MTNRPNIYQYVALTKPREAMALLSRYSLPTPQSIPQLIEALKMGARNYREPFLKELAQIHPDFDLIAVASTPEVEEKKASACGCESHSGCDGDTKCSKCAEKTSGADGQSTGDSSPQVIVQNVEDFNTKMAKYLPTLQLLNLALLGYIIIKKKI